MKKLNPKYIDLRIKLGFGQKKWSIDFLRSGKDKKNLSAKNKDVINFIANKLVIQYIPSIRTPELSSKIVSSLLEKEFEILSAKPEFRLLQEKLDKILKNVFTKISSSVTPMVSSFIPDVKKVTIQNAKGLPSLLSASSIIKVDDGTETQLNAKGDGIISLTAISLLKHISEESKGEKNIILLIEEPESHLHPDAIHSLKNLLSDLNKNQQVILTTHSPIMINRVDVKRNIIVQNKTATPAEKIDEIRRSLGIHISDNLTTAYLILLVEGTKDVRLLHSWLTNKSSLIEASIRNGNLKIESLEGVANLSYKASFYKNILCNIHVFTDDDDEARRAVKGALEKNIIKTDEYNICTCLGMPNSEIEDAVKFECYNTEILKEHGVTLLKSSMSRGNKVWSDKIRIIFEHSGKIWDAILENELKDLVTNAAIKSSPTSLDNSKCKSIDGLIDAVEFKLKRNNK